MSLVPCPSCRRHVRVSEAACPFCQGALPHTLANAAVPSATQRMSRAAVFAFTASLAMTACGPAESPNPPPADSSTDNGGVVPLYGAPADAPLVTDNGPAPNDTGTPQDNGGVAPLYGAPADSGTPAMDAGNPPRDDGGIMELYGAVPPPDSGVVERDAGAPRDNGGVMALYGAVPPPDSGVAPLDRDGGGIVPLYGAPAPQDAGRDGSIGVRYGSPPRPDADV